MTNGDARMSKENAVPKENVVPAETAARAVDEDLSAQIVLAVARKPSERVTCTRITRDHYRCNWWTRQSNGKRDQLSFEGLLATTNRICQSHFLHVTKNTDGLRIVIVSSDAPGVSE
jgi:hypothetical protein